MGAKHTPGPWRKELLGDGTVNVFGSDGYVCDMRSDDGRAHADADLIVRACNAHDDLVRSLEVMTELVRIKYGNLNKDIWEEIEKAQAILAKAGA